MTVSSEILRSISTPEQLETRLGTLELVDGVPTRETAETVYDHLDFAHALNVYLNGFPGASTQALHKGLHDAGAEDNAILIFSELMDSNSLFLTANADTVYFIGFVDLASGPMVIETPPQALALFDDMWFQWIVDFGLPGRQRLPRPALAHDEGDPARPLVHQREPGHGPRSDRRGDQEHAQALPVCPGRLWDEHRDAARGPLAPRSAGGHSRDEVRRWRRARLQHDPTERLRLLRIAERARPGGARGQQ